MHKLTEYEAWQHIDTIRTAAKNSKTWDAMYPKFTVTARLEVPSGELARDDSPAWLGFLWGHRMTNSIILGLPITGKEGFAAQGLEGKVAIQSTLVSVASIWDELPKYRRVLYV